MEDSGVVQVVGTRQARNNIPTFSPGLFRAESSTT